MKKEKFPTTRKCIVSGKVLEKRDLIRFVIDPNENLIPDLDQTLPGRGYWMQEDREVILSAQKKNCPLEQKTTWFSFQIH